MSGPECGPGPGTTEGGQRCPTCCSRVGPESRLRRLQINNEECVSVCADEKCLSNPSSSSLILRRKSSEIPNIRRRRRKHSAPSQEILAPPSFSSILLWRNKDALCWLDASLFLMVFCRSLRRCLATSLNESDSLKSLCREFDNAQVTFQAANPERTIGSGGRHLFAPSELSSEPGSVVSGSTGSENGAHCESINFDSSAVARTGATAVASLDDSSELMRFLDEDTSVWNVDLSGEETVQMVKPTDSLSADSVPYGVGGDAPREGGTTSPGSSSYEVEEPLALLDRVRERLWVEVQPKLMCQRGDEDSPVFALPIILRKNRNLEAHFRSLYHWQFSCSICGFVEITPCKSVMPSLKTLTRSLNVTTYLSHPPCPSCQALAQRNRLSIRSLPPCPMFHFIDGLPKLRSWSQLDFHHGGHEYRVASLVQYKQNPNHFVGWVKDTGRNLWLQGDDLKGPIVNWSREEPDFPAAQCHVVMWERQGRECTDCNSLQSVVRGILEAEHLDLASPSMSRDPERGEWTKEDSGGQEGLSLPCLEGYIPRGAKDLTIVSTGSESGVARLEVDTSDVNTLDVTPMLSDLNATKDATAGDLRPSCDRSPGGANAAEVTENLLEVESDTLSRKVRMTNDAGRLSEVMESSVLCNTSPHCRTTSVADAGQSPQVANGDGSLETEPRLQVANGDGSLEEREDSEKVSRPGSCDGDPESSNDSRLSSPSDLLHSVEQCRIGMSAILCSVPALDGEQEEGGVEEDVEISSEVTVSGIPPCVEEAKATEGVQCSTDSAEQSGITHDFVSNSIGEHMDSEPPETESVVQSIVSLPLKGTDGVPGPSDGDVRKRRARGQYEQDPRTISSGISESTEPSNSTAAVPRLTEHMDVPSLAASLRSSKKDIPNDYKRKLNVLSRVTEWSANEVEGPLRRDLEKRARLGRLATTRASLEKPSQAGGRISRAAEVELVYTGRSDPGRILSSIPSQLDSIPTNGRRNSLETWKLSRGKPMYVGSLGSSSRKSNRALSLRSNSIKSGEGGKRAMRATGLAAKFTTFCQSLPTFSQYKETVEGARQVGHPKAPVRNQRAGSLSPMGSPSGSSESSDYSRMALSVFQEEFMDVTPIASPTQFLPDLEEFFDGLDNE